jgi:hypothetical protein
MKSRPKTEELLKICEFARIVRKSESAIYRLVRAGSIKHIRKGRVIMIPGTEIFKIFKSPIEMAQKLQENTKGLDSLLEAMGKVPKKRD